MSALDWFRTKRALVAELAESRSLAEQAQRLASQRAYQLAEIRIQAMRLREQIRRLETGDVLGDDLTAFIAEDSWAERNEP